MPASPITPLSRGAAADPTGVARDRRLSWRIGQRNFFEWLGIVDDDELPPADRHRPDGAPSARPCRTGADDAGAVLTVAAPRRVAARSRALLPVWTDAATAMRVIGRRLALLPNDDEQSISVADWSRLAGVVGALVGADVFEMRGSRKSGYELRGTDRGMLLLAYEESPRANLSGPWLRARG